MRTLPAVMANLLKRMAPEVADRVDFVHVHGFVTDLLRTRDVRVKIDSRRATQLLDQAWNGLELEQRARLARQRPLPYWQEEVEAVVKGRGFVTFDQYADCARPGRMLGLNVDDRRAVWALCQAYDELLRKEGLCDFQDVVLLAEASLGKQPLERYSAVIVDEAQDLSLAMIRLLFSLVADGPDAFTLIGDGQQSIYPGGYVLSEAGISLAGRGVVMDRNYRNTVQIQEFAESLIAGSVFIDIDDSSPLPTPLPIPLPEEGAARLEGSPHDASSRRARSTHPLRHGSAPEQQRFSTRTAHDSALIERIRKAVRSGAMGVGDIAILCNTNGEAATYERLLAEAQIPTINLLEYEGLFAEKVKVGTTKRAKGLEFKMVMLPWSSHSHASDEEASARATRERYVAATRARDVLWIGSY